MIVRVAERRRYTVIDNQPIEDERLTFKALGVLTYLLSRPDNWTASCQQLATTHREKGYAIRQALAELETNGYITRHREHNPETGRFEWIQEIHEQVDDEGHHDAVFAHPAISHQWETHQWETARVVKTEGTKTEEQSESACAASPSESKKVDYDGSGDPPSVDAVRLKRLPFPPQFAECWNLYPKRCDHDKLGAYKAWRARVVEAPKAGVGRPERMGNLLWAVRGYVLDCEEEDRAEEFMKNASTFFGAANESVMKYCARLARQRYADPDEPEVEVREPVRLCAPLVVVGAGTGPPGRNGASTGHTGAAEGTGT